MTRILIQFIFVIVLSIVWNGEVVAMDEEPYSKDPVVLKPVYHPMNLYEAESYNYWHENKPMPHQHGIEPPEGNLHQHFAKYNDNEHFNNFITGALLVILVFFS